jgi:AcrR family transcriptional regulator
MANLTQPAYGTNGRQSAYTARNRAALIASAQEVLAQTGPGATIEHLVAQAKVSPTTIYNYFDNKEALFSEALHHMWRDWVDWAHDGRSKDESIETMLDVCRKLFRANQTHPKFARVLRNTLDNPAFVIQAVKDDGTTALRRVAKLSGLEASEFDKRLNLWTYCLAGILHGVFVTGELSPADADLSLRMSLSLWNVSPEVASQLTSTPIEG